MSHPPITPEQRFTVITGTLMGEPGVTFDGPEAKQFGASALKIENKIFAMLCAGTLVVKLPRKRVDALVASGDGERFGPGPGPGRRMKEWVSIEPSSGVDWLSLAREGMTFVASQQR